VTKYHRGNGRRLQREWPAVVYCIGCSLTHFRHLLGCVILLKTSL